MKLTSLFLGLVAADQLAAESGNLDDPLDMSMGAGITDHADDQFNQLSKAPTPAPKMRQTSWKALMDAVDNLRCSDAACHMTEGTVTECKFETPGLCPQLENSRWTRKSGVTSSWYTGPRRASEQEYYMYTEASYPNYMDGNKDFYLTSTLETCAIEFSYHMHGSTMGTLSIETSEDQANWSTIWSKTGEQHADQDDPADSLTYRRTSSAAPWTTEQIDLGGLKFVRIHGLVGSSYYSDMAVDHVKFACGKSGSGSKGNVEQLNEQDPLQAMPTSQPTSFPTKDTESLNHPLGNFGTMCESSVAWADGTTKRPVGWVGAGPGADYCNVWKCEVGQSAFTEQNFVGTFRKQKRTCSVEEHGTNYCSHTSCQFTASSSSSETKICDFESDTCSSLLENYGDNSYTYDGNGNYNSNGDGFSRWSGETYSYETGPDNAHKGTGHYMYTEASHPNHDTDFYLATKAKATALEFWFHMKEYSTHMDGAFLKVEQSADGTAGSWTVLDDVAAGAQHDRQDSPFTLHSATSSTPMYLRIHARTGRSWGSDIAIDSVKMTVLGEGGPRVIKVHSDHREEAGGFHKCGFSKHAAARSADRPACDCICHGARRQDAAGFARTLNEVRTAAGTSNPGYGFRGVYGNHDATTDYDTPNDFDATHNSNNFYSQHSNNGQYVHTDATEAARTDTYNQKDQSYNGQQVAHVHIDN